MESKEPITNLTFQTAGIKYEHFNDFNTSYYRHVYLAAYKKIDDIIEKYDKLVQQEPLGAARRYNEFPNVLTFIGKRGTGKTSSMLSFMESLKNYQDITSGQKTDDMFYCLKEQNVLFTCLDCIDSSLLEKGEDIFQMVLAQMYQKFQDIHDKQNLSLTEENEFGYPARELQQKFEELYRTTCILEQMADSNVRAGESYMSSLRTLSSSQKLREKFEKLVLEYLSIIRNRRQSYTRGVKHHFLVITLDDIDLNIQNGFSMLEKIHRYLMIPHIIVLLSLDYNQMLKICMKNFYKVLPKVDIALKTGLEYVRGVSVDYLDKVLPIHYRIYMPEMSNRYATYSIDQKHMPGGAKTYLLVSLFQKSGVLFDSQGLQRHFYEPKSMRVLAGFLMSINHLEHLSPINLSKMDEESATAFYHICEHNHQFLRSDLGTRMAMEQITDESERTFLELVMKSGVHRSLELAIDFIRKILVKSRESSESISEEYNYGILVNMIYRLIRLDGGIHKPLANFLLVYFSYEFTRTYLYEKIQIKDSVHQIAKDGSIKKLIADSITGNWSSDMLPAINIPEASNTTTSERGIEAGYNWLKPLPTILEKGVNGGNSWLKPLPNFKKINLSKNLPMTRWFHIALPPKSEPQDKLTNKLQNIILHIEMLFLSLNCFKIIGDAGDKWGFEIAERPLKDNSSLSVPLFNRKLKRGGCTTAITARFDIFNFVESSMKGYKAIQDLENAILNTFVTYYDNKIQKKKLQEPLLASQYKKWEETFQDNIALPIYHFDLMYNILKRTRRNAIEQNPDAIEKKDLFTYIQKIYDDIANQLQEQINFYSLSVSTDDDILKQCAKFRKCPYINYFLEKRNFQSKQAFFTELAATLLE